MVYSDIEILIRQRLSGLYSGREAGAIARLVAEHITGLSWVQIRLHPDTEIKENQEIQIIGMISRLLNHEPIQYILGETEFYGLKFKVRKGVLIPRGETEELVEWIIKAQGTRHKGQGKDEGRKGIKVLDIGCGSGAIAIAIAKYLPDAEVFAVDISEDALQLTRENAVINGLDVETHNHASLRIFYFNIFSPQGNCHPREGGDRLPMPETFTGISGDRLPMPETFTGITDAGYDIIVSNPPYVPRGEMTSMDHHVVDYEPEAALFVPDDDPLVFYRAIAAFAKSHLNPGGQVFVEIHDRFGEETAAIFRKSFKRVVLRRDIHGKDRMIHAHNG